ncbi:hypothetical protein [Spirulina sp. 06S082]
MRDYIARNNKEGAKKFIKTIQLNRK